MSYESSEDESEEASDQDFMEAADAIGSDLDNFEAFIWPVYRDHGYSRNFAVLCFYLHLNLVEKRGS